MPRQPGKAVVSRRAKGRDLPKRAAEDCLTVAVPSCDDGVERRAGRRFDSDDREVSALDPEQVQKLPEDDEMGRDLSFGAAQLSKGGAQAR